MDGLPTEQSYKVLAGEEYGIWEDAHHELYLFYRDKKAFEKYLKEVDFDAEDFPTKEEFDLESINELYVPFIQRMKMSYEYPEEYDEVMNEVLA